MCVVPLVCADDQCKVHSGRTDKTLFVPTYLPENIALIQMRIDALKEIKDSGKISDAMEYRLKCINNKDCTEYVVKGGKATDQRLKHELNVVNYRWPKILENDLYRYTKYNGNEYSMNGYFHDYSDAYGNSTVIDLERVCESASRSSIIIYKMVASIINDDDSLRNNELLTATLLPRNEIRFAKEKGTDLIRYPASVDKRNYVDTSVRALCSNVVSVSLTNYILRTYGCTLSDDSVMEKFIDKLSSMQMGDNTLAYIICNYFVNNSDGFWAILLGNEDLTSESNILRALIFERRANLIRSSSILNDGSVNGEKVVWGIPSNRSDGKAKNQVIEKMMYILKNDFDGRRLNLSSTSEIASHVMIIGGKQLILTSYFDIQHTTSWPVFMKRLSIDGFTLRDVVINQPVPIDVVNILNKVLEYIKDALINVEVVKNNINSNDVDKVLENLKYHSNPWILSLKTIRGWIYARKDGWADIYSLIIGSIDDDGNIIKANISADLSRAISRVDNICDRLDNYKGNSKYVLLEGVMRAV